MNARRRLKKDEINLIIDKYVNNKISTKKIAKNLNIDITSVRYHLNKNKIKIKKNRIYCVNENYFDVIDTEEKAYFLGLMYSDGYNCQSNGFFRITLVEKDGYILQKFKKALNSDRSLIYNYISKKNKNWQNTISMTINSRYLCESLARHGCLQKKSLILRFPESDHVPDYLISHFIRGYFDGDGHISYNKINLSYSHHFNLVGSLNMIEKINNIFINKLGINKRKIQKTGNVFQFHVTRRRDIQKIKNYLYKDASIFLFRKARIFWLNYKQNRDKYTSKYKNICMDKRRNNIRWRAQFRDKKNQRYSKIFKTQLEAINFLKSINQFIDY